MKNLLVILFTITSYGLIAQLAYTEKYKLYESQIRYIGGTETFAYYLSWKFVSQTTEELTYFKVPMNGGEPEFFEKEKVKMDGLDCRLMTSYVLDDEIYEMYVSFKNGIYIVDGNIMVAKRETKSFEIVGKPVLVNKHHLPSAITNPETHMFIDDSGIIIVGEDSFKDKKGCYVKRFNLNLEEKWSVDIAKFYPEGKDVVTRILYDDLDKMIFFELNLAECENCDGFQMFKKEKKINTTIVGLMYINEEGEQITTVPEVPDGLIYSGSRYYYDGENDVVTGIYAIHKAIGSQYENVSGVGYAFCKWDRESGELMSSQQYFFKFKDVIDSETQKLVSLESPKSTIDQNKDYPKVPRLIPYKLSNGTYFLFAPSIYMSTVDPNYDKNLGPFLNSTCFVANLDAEGNLVWAKSIPFFTGSSLQGAVVTEDDRLIFASIDYHTNYLGGKFALKEKEKNFNAYTVVVVDLVSGEVSQRREFQEKLFTDEYNTTITQFNQPANKFVIGIQNNSGGGFRKVAFGMLNLDK